MFVELILQRYLALCEFRPMARELGFEYAVGTCGTLRLNRDSSEPACHAEKWTLHSEFRLSIHRWMRENFWRVKTRSGSMHNSDALCE